MLFDLILSSTDDRTLWGPLWGRFFTSGSGGPSHRPPAFCAAPGRSLKEPLHLLDVLFLGVQQAAAQGQQLRVRLAGVLVDAPVISTVPMVLPWIIS